MWLNMRAVETVDPEYRELLNKIFDEFEGYVPGFETFKRKMGILVSSPKVQVFYHADVPGQSLWQVEGKKRVYVYPNEAPYLKPESLESIILGEQEEEIPYERSFDDGAEVYDLKPGEMVHWPLNCPHRVENEDCLNISVTTEHWTTDLRKQYAVNYANGILRRKFGVQEPSQSINKWSTYPKAALAVGWRKLNLSKSKQVVRMVDFKVDPKSKTGIADVEAFVKA
jgi:thymidylate synthase ThyX